MEKTLGSEIHKALIALLIEKREAAGMTQEELAKSSASISLLSRGLKVAKDE